MYKISVISVHQRPRQLKNLCTYSARFPELVEGNRSSTSSDLDPTEQLQTYLGTTLNIACCVAVLDTATQHATRHLQTGS
mgnify:CR=1 FL=1